MATLQTVLDLARVPLNDDKVAGSDNVCRYKDTTLLAYLLHGLLHAFRQRQDLWVGNYSNPPSLAWAVAQTFPLPDEYIQPFADYVTARAETGDDEHVLQQRASGFFSIFGMTVMS